MKAERRHELQRNDLAETAKSAVKVMQLPDLRRKWVGRSLTALAILVLIAILVRMRIANAETAQANAAEHLAIAGTLIDGLRQPRLDGPIDAKFIANVQKIAEQANSELDKINTGDAKLTAQAGVLRGDMNFLVANVPVLDKATTAPSGPALDRPVYLSQSLAAYQDVVDKYADQPINSISAQFGIAAIMENRGEWAEAEKRYQALMANPDGNPQVKVLAEIRLKEIPKLKARQPVLLERAPIPPLIAATRPATQPSTQPLGALTPAAGAKAHATTRPSAATRPATQAK
jgi:hypothetical protein